MVGKGRWKEGRPALVEDPRLAGPDARFRLVQFALTRVAKACGALRRAMIA